MTGSTNKILNYLNEIIPDPKPELIYHKDYELLIAVMLSAQTTDKKVNEVTKILFNKYKTLKDLKNADQNKIKEIIRPLGNYNKKSNNIIQIAKHLDEEKEGKVPDDREYLESLPGVGRKTANVILSTLFDEPFIAVDTHILRVSNRLGITTKKDDPYQTEKKLEKKFKGYNFNRLHHQLLLFGRYTCTSRNPKCDNCKLFQICKYKEKLKHEYSYGTVTKKVIDNQTKYLLIKHRLGHICFPKGHIEKNETKYQTAYRETLEETNIKTKINKTKEYSYTYYPHKNILKTVTLFNADYIEGKEKPQPEEVDKIMWLTKEETLESLTFKEEKEAFKKLVK